VPLKLHHGVTAKFKFNVNSSEEPQPETPAEEAADKYRTPRKRAKRTPRDCRGTNRAAEKPRKDPGNGSGRAWPERGGDGERQKHTASSPDIHRALPHSAEAEQGRRASTQ